MKQLTGLLLLVVVVLLEGKSRAQALEQPAPAFLSNRHIIILQADLKNIWGTYFFAVTNPAMVPAEFETLITLPDDTVDFRAQDGLSDADLRLDDQGRLYIKKTFQPGLNLLGVGFQVKASKSGADLIHMTPLVDIPELSVAVPVGSSLKVSGPQFKAGVPPMLAGGKYTGMIATAPVGKGSGVTIHLDGIPKDRFSFTLLGGLVFVLFLLTGTALTIKTRVKVKELDEASL